MVSTSGGFRHGGKRNNSGRKRKIEDRGEYKKAWLRNHKRIYLKEKIFKLWLLRMSTRDSVPLNILCLPRCFYRIMLSRFCVFINLENYYIASENTKEYFY
jgi:hypothetical protein